MNTAQALAELGVTDADFTDQQRQQFDEQGYFIVEDYFTPEQVAQLRAENEALRRQLERVRTS